MDPRALVPAFPPRAENRALLVPERAPPSLRWGARVAIGLVLVAYFTIAYEAVRAMQGTFGFSIGSMARAFLPALALGVFTIPLALLLELPEHWYLRHRPARRRARGLCPGCGYPLLPHAPSCPECGSDGTVRAPAESNWSTLRRFALMALIALLVGAGVGESLIQIDEARFRADVRARAGMLAAGAPSSGPVVARRRRAWPGSFAILQWESDGDRYSASAPALVRRR